MKVRIAYVIELTIRSPFLFRGLANLMLGVDAAQIRDEQGRPLIPSDQIRGVLKEALGDIVRVAPQIISAAEIDGLFGKPSSESVDLSQEQDRPDRGALIFSDLVTDECLYASSETTRIEIDDATGAASTGQLQVIELVAPFDAEVRFKGEILAFWPAAEAERLGTALTKALETISAIGAFKSVGFGEIVRDNSTICQRESQSLGLPKPQANIPDRRAYWVTFDRPILADAAHISDNAFRGNAIIPGAVFKGALADRLKYAGELPQVKGSPFSEALAALRISHAWPESKDGRPSGFPLPLSLVGRNAEPGGEAELGDALGIPYDRGAAIGHGVARFRPDWAPAREPALLLQSGVLPKGNLRRADQPATAHQCRKPAI